MGLHTSFRYNADRETESHMNDSVKVAEAAPPILRCKDADGVVMLTLNRPERRNSLSEAVLVALADSLSAVAGDRTVRAVNRTVRRQTPGQRQV